ncbi:MAG: hypothetical protein AAB416_05100 [Patescibacteria group bacterium]
MPRSRPEPGDEAQSPHRHTARLKTLVTWLTRVRTVDRQGKDPFGQRRVVWVNGISIDVVTKDRKMVPLQEEFKELAGDLRDDLRQMRGRTLASVKAALGFGEDPSNLALRALALGHSLKCWTLDLDGPLGTGNLHDDNQVVIRDLRFS